MKLNSWDVFTACIIIVCLCLIAMCMVTPRERYIREFEFRGHDYIEFDHGVIHDPDCKKEKGLLVETIF